MRISYFAISGYKRFNGKKVEYAFNTFVTPNIVRFVGPNGSGKSTILNALSPLPDSPSDIVPGIFGEKRICIAKKRKKSSFFDRTDAFTESQKGCKI